MAENAISSKKYLRANSNVQPSKANEDKKVPSTKEEVKSISSDEYKNSLYPKDYTPLLAKNIEPQQNSKKPGYGIDIIKNLDVNDNFITNKEILIALYDTKLDEYIEKINNFDIDNDKKILLMAKIVYVNHLTSNMNAQTQLDKLINLFEYCLEDIKKLNINNKQDEDKLNKMYMFKINNYNNEKSRSIIFDDKYDLLPINLINYIGTFYNANEEIDNFLSYGNEINELKNDDYFSKQIDDISGKLLYEFLNLLHHTDETSEYKNLSSKDLIFCKTFLSGMKANTDDVSSLILNKMLNKLRPNLSVEPNEEDIFKKEFDEKLSTINELYSQMCSQISNEAIEALNNILTIEDGLKDVDVESINMSTIESDKTLNYIFHAVPDLMKTVGREQAGHTYTLDKHIISVAQNVVKDDEYQKLDENNKKILLIAALMHDISKKEGGADSQHPQTGAEFAYNALKNVLNEKDRLTLSNLIYNHHFNALVGNESLINNVAYECANDKNEQFMQMLSILGKADLYGNPLIKEQYLPSLEPNIKTLNARIEQIKQTLSKMKAQIALTPFPQNSIVDDEAIKEQNKNEMCQLEILSACKYSQNDESIPVIDLTKMRELKDEDKQSQYFETLGFGKDTTCDNLHLLVHAIGGPNHVQGIEDLINTYKTDAILSASGITMNDIRLYGSRFCGFVFDSDNTSILAVSNNNLFSGIGKNRSQIGSWLDYSFNQKPEFPSEKTNKCENGLDNSEILVTDFSPSAIFVRKSKYETFVKNNAVSDLLLSQLFNFAQKHKLPLILIP